VTGTAPRSPARRTSSTTLDPRSLRALTVELPPGSPADVNAMVARSEVCFADEHLALGGQGTAAVLPLPGGLADATALDRVGTWLAALPHRAPPADGQPGRWPVPAVTALGALAFERSSPGHLVVPELLVRLADDGRRWATAVVTGPEQPDPAEVAGRAGSLLAPVPPSAESTAALLGLSERPPGEDYRAAVARALELTDGGALAKVVLARTVAARFSDRVTAAAAVRRLRAGEPSCTVFSFPVGTDFGVPGGKSDAPARFLGASPELLVRRVGAAVESHPLAGTASLDDEGGDGGAPGHRRAAERLLASAKDRAEHRLVVDAVTASLRSRCAGLSVPAGPSVVRLGSVAHLGTALRGTLRAGPDGNVPSVLALVADLHPTPAVGGVPRTEALACIARLEPSPRGHWAGPVGWVDGSGDGQWMLGIRSATVEGASAFLTAGAGIVAGSDPDAELRETTVKLAPVLEALAPGAAHLLSR
jgi:menaquinone-specific isochorismate synthase